MTPAAVREVTNGRHQVLIETNAGDAIGLFDEVYQKAGATIARNADQVFGESDMIVKVKEPQAEEIKRLRHGQTLFTYLHLAPDPEQTRGLLNSGAICIAYETVTDARGGLPLLSPMSEVAGRMSIQAGARSLEMQEGEQGGCAETSRPTTHANPTYKVHDVVHYCVANMPGGVARTSTFALNNATLPFTVALAEQGPEKAMATNPHLRAGLNAYKGTLTYKAVADAQHLPYKHAEEVLGLSY